jgi:hypothetical protein
MLLFNMFLQSLMTELQTEQEYEKETASSKCK